MKEKDITALITLCAGAVASITCIVNGYPLLSMLEIVLVVLLIFYIIGRVTGRVISKINKAANDAYVLAERERMKAQKVAEAEHSMQESEDKESSETTAATAGDEEKA